MSMGLGDLPVGSAVASSLLSAGSLAVGLAVNDMTIQRHVHEWLSWTAQGCGPWTWSWFALWIAASLMALLLAALPLSHPAGGRMAPRSVRWLVVGLAVTAVLYWIGDAIGSSLTRCEP